MKKLLLILLLATNVCVAQKKIAIVLTGYDTTKDNWAKANVEFVDTSYYHIPFAAWTVFEKDSIYYNLCREANGKEGFTFVNFYHYSNRFGSEDFYNAYPVLFYIVRQKLVSLGKM